MMLENKSCLNLYYFKLFKNPKLLQWLLYYLFTRVVRTLLMPAFQQVGDRSFCVQFYPITSFT